MFVVITEQQVREILGQLQRSILHKSLAETDGITNVAIKEEKIM